MDKDRKIFVSIYCKIYNDSFNDKMVDRLATGQEIYDFLVEDACHCFDEDGSIVPGDLNLWYLGCCEKFGHLSVENKVWDWSFGGSSFDIVHAFVEGINSMGLFTEKQYQSLLEKIEEGRQVDNMYLIGLYLRHKREGKPWTKDPKAGDFRQNIKRMVWDVGRSFRNSGYKFYSGGPEKNYYEKGDSEDAD